MTRVPVLLAGLSLADRSWRCDFLGSVVVVGGLPLKDPMLSRVPSGLTEREQMCCRAGHLLVSHMVPSAETKLKGAGAKGWGPLPAQGQSPVGRVSDGELEAWCEIEAIQTEL